MRLGSEPEILKIGHFKESFKQLKAIFLVKKTFYFFELCSKMV